MGQGRGSSLHRYSYRKRRSTSSGNSEMRLFNPISFTPWGVTVVVAVVYLAVLTPLVIIHETVPPAPENPTLYRGLNLSEAWVDLTSLSNGYHPYNSRRNDEVRDWLLTRINTILVDNGVKFTSVGGPAGNTESKGSWDPEATAPQPQSVSTVPQGTDISEPSHDELRVRNASPPVTIFNDLFSNYTSTALTSIGVSSRSLGISTYFEGTNIIVYIPGTQDEHGEWWNTADSDGNGMIPHGKGGVMVNAHYDSVSTGFGATDNGVGVITALQLIRYFTTPSLTPKKGVVVLLNNGEEDGLYGAKAFLSHPMATFVHTFLNLEGAGAGGRATLFRSTNKQVTDAYGKALHPFGSVISADGFSLGFVRSETDYVVFKAEGFRGLDVAFWEPRSRYHTDQDDARHSSPASLWHMLSASVETMKYLTSETSKQFDGPRGDGNSNKVRNGQGVDAVWFDLFGQIFVVFELRILFASSLALLVVGPITLWFITFVLIQKDKFYFLTGSAKPEGHDSEEVSLKGWRGAFRFPVITLVSSGLTVGAAFLLRKLNPMIIYSSPYAVWAMSICLFFCSFWFMSAGCNAVRPSALTRGYSLIWMQSFGWAVLVGVVVLQDRFQVSGGYMFVFYYAAVLLAAVISLCELFTVPSKQDMVACEHDLHDIDGGFRSRSNSNVTLDIDRSPIILPTNERTPLLGSILGRDDNLIVPGIPGREDNNGDSSNNEPHSLATTFASRFRRDTSKKNDRHRRHRRHSNNRIDGRRRDSNCQSDGDWQRPPEVWQGPAGTNSGSRNRRRDRRGRSIDYYLRESRPYGKEQNWSAYLPSWTWILQFLLIAPFMLIILGQVGLLLTTATAQTGTDGSPMLLPYLIVAIFSILLLLPIGPFIHRITPHLPIFLFLLFIGTLGYNLLAFPFSANSRYKAYFQQTVDLDTGINQVTISGIEKYVRQIIDYIPSAAGQSISCETRPRIRAGLSFCSYEGIAPKVVGEVKDGVPPDKGYSHWLTFDVIRAPGLNRATFHLTGNETKACILRFDDPFTAFHVEGAASSSGRWADVPETGSDQIKLWHRDWNREWVVEVEWAVSDGKSAGEEGRSGRVVCLWSDYNMQGKIPALDEIKMFAPDWSSISKSMDGLVEGSKAFMI